MKKSLLIMVTLSVLIFPGLNRQAEALIAGAIELEVAADRTWATSLSVASPGFGDSFFIRGYIYAKGTLAENCPSTQDCGIISGPAPFSGQPEFPEKQIGTYYVSGNFFADPFTGVLGSGEEVGLFQVIFQFFDGGDLLIAKGIQRFGQNGSHPAKLAVLGGTGAFAKARGEVIESMVTQNGSGAFTFRYDLRGVIQANREQSLEILGGFLKKFKKR